MHPRLVGHGPALFAGLAKYVDLQLVSRPEFQSGAVAMRYVPKGSHRTLGAIQTLGGSPMSGVRAAFLLLALGTAGCTTRPSYGPVAPQDTAQAQPDPPNRAPGELPT
jgi:hypothetical protein